MQEKDLLAPPPTQISFPCIRVRGALEIRQDRMAERRSSVDRSILRLALSIAAWAAALTWSGVSKFRLTDRHIDDVVSGGLQLAHTRPRQPSSGKSDARHARSGYEGGHIIFL